jgi:hypothetical protein
MPEGQATESIIEGLRVRRCGDPACNAMFAVCARCDRGQRYCSPTCRRRMRQQQLRAAGQRYQRSDQGRQAHRRRQRAFRQRRSIEGVTHQAPVSITTAAANPTTRITQCTICGLQSRWINPFYSAPGRKPHRRSTCTRSNGVRNSTFPVNANNYFCSARTLTIRSVKTGSFLET